MEQFLALMLGVSAVALIGVIVVALRTANKVNDLKQEVNDLYTQFERNDMSLKFNFGEQTTFAKNLFKDSQAYTDSRIDKLEAKIKVNTTPNANNITQSNEPVAAKKTIKKTK
jgi:uncharacterized membrane-anchored protein YhcB (DUF1043 family)